MKVFDATALIAFISEMDFKEGLVFVSKKYELIVPRGVVDEITKPRTKECLKDLIERKVIRIIEPNGNDADEINRLYPQLHKGECEVIAFAQRYNGGKKLCILSDDKKARKTFNELNFKWTERLLDIMKEKGMISDSTYSEVKQRLMQSPFYHRGRKG